VKLLRFLVLAAILFAGGYATAQNSGPSDADKLRAILVEHQGRIVVTGDEDFLYITLDSDLPRGAGWVLPWDEANSGSIGQALRAMTRYVYDGSQ
jgi:hypothetical protein